MPPLPKDPWQTLSALTPARIALGRTGASQPTQALLNFELDHARARDAVHMPLDLELLDAQLQAAGLRAITVESEAVDRAVYLRRPDYGRRLSIASRARLDGIAVPPSDVALIIADGLSAAAVHAHAAALVQEFLKQSRGLGLVHGPVIVARGARVGLGDDIGALLQTRVVAMLIGERPGLSSPDSLGVYLTCDPRRGRTDAERNCISNIRAEGLSYAHAAFKLTWLLREALRRSLTGVTLKDESDLMLKSGDVPPLLE